MKVVELDKLVEQQSVSVQNNLFPVFLKLEELNVLVVGAGKVGLEKLSAIIHNSPLTIITVVAKEISESVINLAALHDNIVLKQKAFDESDLTDKGIVFVAVNEKHTSQYIKELAARRKLLVNVADTPELCDFYLSSVVQKGDLKIGISTNGKSPTIAKRMKEVINDMIPQEMESVLENMSIIRQGMNGNFEQKVKQLNDITKMLVSKQLTLEESIKPEQKRWQKIVKWCLFAFVFMIIGHEVLSYAVLEKIVDGVKTIPDLVDTKEFLLMLLTGFLAQMVDGSLGMGYGTISTTFLLANGVNPAIVSSRVHSARVFSS
ncbi:MAG: NAD(P)-dependent oxidoreductase, partial [Flavisolibacter sp.]